MSLGKLCEPMIVLWIIVTVLMFSSSIYCQVRCARIESEAHDDEDLLSALLGNGWCRGSTHESRDYRLLAILTIVTGLLAVVEVFRRIAVLTEG